MKFMILFKDDPAVIDFAKKRAGWAFGNGACLLGWKKFDVYSKSGNKPVRHGIAYLCKGTPVSYLWHKIKFHHYSTVKIGWF